MNESNNSNPLLKRFVLLLIIGTILALSIQTVNAESAVPQVDQTPLIPLSIPDATNRPRYLTGFGEDNAYTIFFEDRNDAVGCSPAGTYRIKYAQTTSGPNGLSAPIATDLCETHFLAKPWPVTIGATTYAYRGWGAVGNVPDLKFYVSNDLTHWIYVSTFFIPVPNAIVPGGDSIYYGFHDVVELNGTYVAFGETNQGRTIIVTSTLGTDSWTSIAVVGGVTPTFTGPLNLALFPGISGITSSGNFVLMELDGQIAYGKLMLPGDDSAAYLAINRAAAIAPTPAAALAAFIDPANWTWRDGSTGIPSPGNAVLTSTFGIGGHDVREAWTVPTSDYRADHVILYTASYVGTAAPLRGIGCAASDPQCLVVLPATPTLLPSTGFAPGVITPLQLASLSKYYNPTEVWLSIPKLGVEAKIVGVPYTDGTWDVSWLGSSVGYLQGTAFPTLPGNTALTGHVYDADGKPGLFMNLKSLSYGDKIYLYAWGNQYKYEVRTNTLILPSNMEILKHEELDWLSLITCQGYNSTNNEYLFRRVIRSVLVDVIEQ